jgi:hypothetical protein
MHVLWRRLCRSLLWWPSCNSWRCKLTFVAWNILKNFIVLQQWRQTFTQTMAAKSLNQGVNLVIFVAGRTRWLTTRCWYFWFFPLHVLLLRFTLRRNLIYVLESGNGNVIAAHWLVGYLTALLELQGLYRVIHKSLRYFRTLQCNNQDRHSRKEHINRYRNSPSV